MRYNHLDMLPEKAFNPVGKRMTLEGGGVGSVLGTAGSIAAGGSPLGAFGSTLGGQLLQGGGGGGSGGGGAAGGVGIGTQNQTQITGPLAGMNPASIAYKMKMQEMQQQAAQQAQQPGLTPTPAQQPAGGAMVSGQLPPDVLRTAQMESRPIPQFAQPLVQQAIPQAPNFDAFTNPAARDYMQGIMGIAQQQGLNQPNLQQMQAINDLQNRMNAPGGGMMGKGQGMAGPGKPPMPPGGMGGKGGSMPNRPIPTPLRDSMGGLRSPGGMVGKGGKFGGMG